MTGFISVYVTFPDIKTAEIIARALVEKGLAACINLIPAMTSIYRWQGEIHTDAECAFIAKCASAEFDNVSELIKSQHPYDCPCIVAWPIVHADADYLKFLAAGCASYAEHI